MRSCQRQIRNQKRHLNQSLIKLCQKLCPRRRSLTSSILRGHFPSCRLLKMNEMFTTYRVRISTLLKMNGTMRKILHRDCSFPRGFIPFNSSITLYYIDCKHEIFLRHINKLFSIFTPDSHIDFCVSLACVPFPFLFDGPRKTAYWGPGLGFLINAHRLPLPYTFHGYTVI